MHEPRKYKKMIPRKGKLHSRLSDIVGRSHGWMDGWMGGRTDGRTDGWRNFTTFSTVFQLYQEDERLIMKVCVQGNLVYGWKDLRLMQGSNPGPFTRIKFICPGKFDKKSLSVWPQQRMFHCRHLLGKDCTARDCCLIRQNLQCAL